MAHALQLTLEVLQDGKPVQSKTFDKASITIGSGDAADLTVHGGEIAPLHAVLNVAGSAVNVLDLVGSDSSLKVNGEQVANQALSHGDVLELAGVTVVVKLPQAEESEEEEATLVEARPATAATDSRTPAPATPAPEDAPTPPTASDRVMSPLVDDAGPAHDHQEDSMDSVEEVEETQTTEDVMSFVMRSGSGSNNLGIDKDRPKVLEVSQTWENVLLDTKHFPKGGKAITTGSSVGKRWEFLGVSMGWVGLPLSTILKYTPPMWSDVVSDWKSDFYSPDDEFNGADHKLFVWDNDHYVARVKQGWGGFVDMGNERHTFEDLLANGKADREDGNILVPIEDDSKVMVEIGGVKFFSQMVHPGKRVLSRMSESVDYPFIAIFSLVGFIGLMFGVLMLTLPPPPENEMVEIPDRFVELLIEKPEVEQEKKKPSGNPDAGEGAKAKREEGKVGKKDSEMEKAKGNKVEIQKQQRDREIAENAGVLGANLDGGELEGVFGSNAVDSSLMGGIGGATGAKGVQRGSGGLGSSGSGLGGGGTAEGLGGLGTKGSGSGASGYGSGGGNFGAKGEGAIGTVGGDPIILGALDRSLIDEVIKRHMAQIRYCYQRELTKDATLSGKIVIKFTIAKDGTVSAASTKTTTMNNSAVESCVVGRFMRMQFPQPKGGGIVIVSYPFLFSPG